MYTLWYRRNGDSDPWWEPWDEYTDWADALAEGQPLLCVPSVQCVRMTRDGETVWAMQKSQIVKAWSLA